MAKNSDSDSRSDSHSDDDEEISKGRPLAVDPAAVSASPDVPAFLARPEGAPIYYGFPILHDVSVEGFVFGMITNFEQEPCEQGDAFVVAPDGSRAGLVWDVSARPYFEEVILPEAGRWGVWAVSFPHPMNSRENARRNLAAILPELKQKWMAWTKTRQG